MKRIGGLLLAAGKSSRLGSGYHKLLAEYDCVPLVRKSAQTMLSCQLTCVTVVIGCRHSEIKSALDGLPVVFAYNESFHEGMGTSIACGFKHISLADCDAILIMLGDMPRITADHINELLAASQASDGAVVRASDGGKPGHPIIVPSQLFSEMRNLNGSEGAKQVIAKSSAHVRLVNFGSAALEDVDSFDDLVRTGGKLSS